MAYGLTERELLVLRLAKVGRSDAQIGNDLIVSSLTVGAHLRNIAAKLGVGTREQAIEKALREGLG
jgi:two-component system NarL family response regulator